MRAKIPHIVSQTNTELVSRSSPASQDKKEAQERYTEAVEHANSTGQQMDALTALAAAATYVLCAFLVVST